MASLSSKRKTSANRRLQGRDRRSDNAPKMAARQPVATQIEVGPFDENTYINAKPRFDEAMAQAGAGGDDVAKLMRVLIQQEFDAGGRTAALQMQPYIVKYVGECREAQLKSSADLH